LFVTTEPKVYFSAEGSLLGGSIPSEIGNLKKLGEFEFQERAINSTNDSRQEWIICTSQCYLHLILVAFLAPPQRLWISSSHRYLGRFPTRLAIWKTLVSHIVSSSSSSYSHIIFNILYPSCSISEFARHHDHWCHTPANFQFDKAPYVRCDEIFAKISFLRHLAQRRLIRILIHAPHTERLSIFNTRLSGTFPASVCTLPTIQSICVKNSNVPCNCGATVCVCPLN
jgi:hypothetical protein